MINAFLPKVPELQPSPPFVWGGTTIHARPKTAPGTAE